MIKFFLVALVAICVQTSVKADEFPVLISAEMKAKWEHLHEDLLKIELKSTTCYSNEKINVVGQLSARTSIHKHGERVSLNIEKAYFDYVLADKLIFSLGRDAMENVLESRLQSASKFNGMMLTSRHDSFVVRGGGFVVGEENLFGAFSQAHVRLLELPVLLSYSMTYWGSQPSVVGISKDYLISQATYKYLFSQKVLGQPLEFVGGFVMNHKTNRANKGWHVGYIWGNSMPTNAKEWGLGLSYQDVDVYTIPAHDMNGIGRGKAARGVVIEMTYTLTDHLSIKGKTEIATLSRSGGEKQNYAEFATSCKF